jgi:hypothetical protein
MMDIADQHNVKEPDMHCTGLKLHKDHTTGCTERSTGGIRRYDQWDTFNIG